MKKLGIALLVLLPALLRAEPVVVVASASPISALTEDEVRQLFNGHSHRVDGHSLKPLDLPSRSATRAAFYQRLMNKNAEQMKSYWARMIFTGRGMPPRELASNREMILLLGSNRHFIGYLDDSQLTAKLKVVYRP